MKRSLTIGLVVSACLLLLVVFAVSSKPSFKNDVALAQATSTGVTFIKEVYNHTDVPYSLSAGFPFIGVTQWLSGGYFVLSGQCGLQERFSDRISALGRDNVVNFVGGMYAFKEDGTFVGRRNVCHDGDVPGAGQGSYNLTCPEGFACDVSTRVTPTGPNSLVRELTPIMHRPLINYQISPSGISIAGKSNTGSVFMGPEISHAALSGNTVIAARRTVTGGDLSDGGRYGSATNVTFSLPSLTQVKESPAQVVPVVSVGNLVVGFEATSINSAANVQFLGNYSLTGARVYRVKTDGSFEQVGTLPNDVYIRDMARDSSNPNRVAFLQGATNPKAVVYEAGANGLTLIRTVDLPKYWEAGRGAISPVKFFALSGDYIVYATNEGHSATNCIFRVRKGNTDVGCALPPTPTTPAYAGRNADAFEQRVQSIEISPNGYVLVGTATGSVYLFRIGGVSNPNGGQPNTPPSPTSTTTGDYVAGQNLTISYTTSPALVTISLGRVLSIATSSLSVRVFGRTFVVDASNAVLTNNSFAPTTLNRFSPFGYVNLTGTLDTENASLIRATRIRDLTPAPPANLSAPASAATQTQLSTLQQALKALLLRLGQ